MDTETKREVTESAGRPMAPVNNVGLRWTAINLNRSLQVLACLDGRDLAAARELLELYVNDSMLALAHAEKTGRLSEAESRALASGLEYRLANRRCKSGDAVHHASQLHAAATRVADEASKPSGDPSVTEWISAGARRLFNWRNEAIPSEG